MVVDFPDAPPLDAPAPFPLPGQIEAPDMDQGSDMEDDDEYQQFFDFGEYVSAHVYRIYRQFLSDMTAEAPNKKGAHHPSYCRIPKADRENVNEDTYKNPNLRDYFIDCQFKRATKKEWNCAFDHAFPNRGVAQNGKRQNYGRCRYYKRWGKLMLNDAVSDADFNRIREAIRERLRSFYWLPNFLADRMWGTKPLAKFSKISGCNAHDPAPMILINYQSKDRPYWE